MVVTSSPNPKKNSPKAPNLPLSLGPLLDQLRQDFPSLVFKPAKRFLFRPPKTILVNPSDPDAPALTLHELGHALLNHHHFSTHPERLKMERAAWEKARELSPHYGIAISDDFIEDSLDSYRIWLDQKSRCKKCGLSRYQTPDGKYHCPHCEDFA